MGRLVIRHTRVEEVGEVMRLFDLARAFMRSTGNMSQWTDGYPSRAAVMADIDRGNSYVCVDEEGEIVATFAFIIGADPTYGYIEGGSWLDDRKQYGTIHRLASSGKRGGVLAECVDYCFTKVDSLRLDTHADNSPMLAGAERLGFTRCGIIYLADGSPRVAFQKVKS